MAVEGPRLMPGEGFGLGMVLLENMLDGLEDYERFDQSLGCMHFLLMSAVFENILPKFCNVIAAAFNWMN